VRAKKGHDAIRASLSIGGDLYACQNARKKEFDVVSGKKEEKGKRGGGGGRGGRGLFPSQGEHLWDGLHHEGKGEETFEAVLKEFPPLKREEYHFTRRGGIKEEVASF